MRIFTNKDIKTLLIGISLFLLCVSFKRFYRSRFSNSRFGNLDTQGLGLGLPLSKTIVELHGGNIKVDSVLGKGSAFIIDIFKITKL